MQSPFQLSTTDLLELADLKDLIAEGKRNEAMPGLYALAAKYPQSVELQNLIKVSLILLEPVPPVRNQPPPQWNAAPPPPYGEQPGNYYQPYGAPAYGYSSPAYSQMGSNSAPGGCGLFLYFLAWFIGTSIVWSGISYVGRMIQNGMIGGRDISQLRTYAEFEAYNAHLPQIQTVQFIQWVVTFGIVLATTIWLTIDTVQRRNRFGPKSASNPVLVFVLCSLFWILAFPLMMTDRYRARYLYPGS